MKKTYRIDNNNWETDTLYLLPKESNYDAIVLKNLLQVNTNETIDFEYDLVSLSLQNKTIIIDGISLSILDRKIYYLKGSEIAASPSHYVVLGEQMSTRTRRGPFWNRNTEVIESFKPINNGESTIKDGTADEESSLRAAGKFLTLGDPDKNEKIYFTVDRDSIYAVYKVDELPRMIPDLSMFSNNISKIEPIKNQVQYNTYNVLKVLGLEETQYNGVVENKTINLNPYDGEEPLSLGFSIVPQPGNSISITQRDTLNVRFDIIFFNDNTVPNSIEWEYEGEPGLSLDVDPNNNNSALLTGIWDYTGKKTLMITATTKVVVLGTEIEVRKQIPFTIESREFIYDLNITSPFVFTGSPLFVHNTTQTESNKNTFYYYDDYIKGRDNTGITPVNEIILETDYSGPYSLMPEMSINGIEESYYFRIDNVIENKSPSNKFKITWPYIPEDESLFTIFNENTLIELVVVLHEMDAGRVLNSVSFNFRLDIQIELSDDTPDEDDEDSEDDTSIKYPYRGTFGK